MLQVRRRASIALVAPIETAKLRIKLDKVPRRLLLREIRVLVEAEVREHLILDLRSLLQDSREMAPLEGIAPGQDGLRTVDVALEDLVEHRR